jgi:flagellar biosynthesis protein FlhB
MQQLRKEGQLFVSQEVLHAVVLMTGFLVLKQLWNPLLQDMKRVLRSSFGLIANTEPLTVSRLHDGFVGLLLLLGPEIFLLVGAVALSASAAVMLQTQWNIKEKKIDVRFSGLNPVAGIMRIFSPQGAITTGKALLKLLLIIPVGYFVLKQYAHDMVRLVLMHIEDVFSFTGAALDSAFWRIFYLLLAFAIFDYVYGRFRWLKQNKMTKQEVKDEQRSVEGDEATKRRIQQKGLARIAQRIAQTVPKADVVITNPTHYAIALKYDRGTMRAPIVVAKGVDHLALRIREIAKESGVPIVERKALARALYASTKPGTEIPYELFKAVAEVLAYVYRLKNPHVRR